MKKDGFMHQIDECYIQRDQLYHVHSFTHLGRHEQNGAVVIERGDGIYLTDSNGKQYLDAMASLWCVNLGYSEQRLVDAAARQMAILPYSHTFRGRSHSKVIELSEKLVAITPKHLNKVYFAGSGSEANESAIKLAWAYHKARGHPRKRKIISRSNAYHGSTIFATSLTGMPAMHEFNNVDFAEVLHTDFPDYLSCFNENESETEFATRLAENLETMILAEGADTIAAFIAEPVMGVGGVIVPPKTYFEKIQAIFKRHGILMIADEVICGFGRTGNMFGCQTFNIVPDILSIAKGITSAYFPMSAVITTDPIYKALVQVSDTNGGFSHGFTYSGHPVGAAVALETIEIIEERKIVEHVQSVSKKFHSALNRLLDFPIVKNVRGIGLMGGLEFQYDGISRSPYAQPGNLGSTVMDLAAENGLFVRSVGDSIVLAPPLIISKAEVEDLYQRLEKTLAEFVDLIEVSDNRMTA